MGRTYLALIAALGLGAMAISLSPYHALTPGTLRSGHEAQQGDCLSCHSFFDGAPASKCAACHRPGDIGLRTVKGAPLPKANPRAQLIHRAALECDRCHYEHGGRMGASAAPRFAHDLLPADVKAGCALCHAEKKPADALHTAVIAECSRCHGTKAWKPAAYDHDKLFRFDRNHPPRCADCHRPGTTLKEYTCTGCHEHALDKMERKHREEGITQFQNCRKCHPSGDEHDTIKEGRQRNRRENNDD